MAHYMEDQRSCMLYTTGSLYSLRMADSPARAIDQGLRRLDFSAFDAERVNNEGGRPALDPRCL